MTESPLLPPTGEAKPVVKVDPSTEEQLFSSTGPELPNVPPVIEAPVLSAPVVTAGDRLAKAIVEAEKLVAVFTFTKTQHTLDEVKFKDGSTYTFPRVVSHTGVLAPSTVNISDVELADKLRRVAAVNFITELKPKD